MGYTEETTMENQHRKISGYRDLNQSEIDAMNELKLRETALLGYFNELGRVAAHHTLGTDGSAIPVMLYDQRWLSIARTHIQEGIAAAVRAVARPDES